MTKAMTKWRLRKDAKGAALIISLFIVAALITLSAGFALSMVNELNSAKHHRDGTVAFWLAEAGINQFIQDQTMLNATNPLTVYYGSNTNVITKDDSNVTKRVVTSVGTAGGHQRTVQIEFLSSPDVYNDTIAVGGNLTIQGNKSTISVNGKTRINGTTVDSLNHGTTTFEDKQEGVNSNLVTLKYPDSNNNGTGDEFADFVQFNRNLLASYSANEVVYLQGNGTYTISPNASLSGKKIVYVEGSEGDGNVNIQFTGAWENGQNLTIISTGNVIYNQPNATPTDSQLNIIAWSSYSETAALPGSHKGMAYSHGSISLDDVHDVQTINGVLAANQAMSIREVWSTDTINYVDPRSGSTPPPGFQGLLGASNSGYSSTPSNWKEI